MKSFNRVACASLILVTGGSMPTVVAAQTAGMTMSGSDSPAAVTGTTGATVRVGALEISSAYAKAMLPGQPVGGGYLTIRNTGKVDDRLVQASSPNARTVDIHEMSMQGQVMKMRKLEEGLAIPAGQTVMLAPGGFHLMFMAPSAPFRLGDQIPVTLTFETAGKIDIVIPVQAAGPASRP